MNDTVAGRDVGLGDGSFSNHQLLAGLGDRERLLRDRVRLGELHRLRGAHLTRDHVILEDGGELLLVLEQALDGALRQLGEGLVGGSEDGEGPFALQGLGQAAASMALARVLKEPAAFAVSMMSAVASLEGA